MDKRPQVFLAHAREDKDAIRQLYAKLTSHGFKPWLDEVDLLPGQNWQLEISKAIRNSTVFAACLSRKSTEKRGYVQREFRIALDECAERPPGSIYFIPIKLDDCELSDLRIPGLGIALQEYHWVEVWKHDGFDRLVKSIEHAVSSQQNTAAAASVPANEVREFSVTAQARTDSWSRQIEGTTDNATQSIKSESAPLRRNTLRGAAISFFDAQETRVIFCIICSFIGLMCLDITKPDFSLPPKWPYQIDDYIYATLFLFVGLAILSKRTRLYGVLCGILFHIIALYVTYSLGRIGSSTVVEPSGVKITTYQDFNEGTAISLFAIPFCLALTLVFIDNRRSRKV